MSLSSHSDSVLKLVRGLQSAFVCGLESVSADAGCALQFEKAEWLRDGGAHGGGDRFFTANKQVFNRASVNVSQIHYHDLPGKALASATAISTIIHPQNPHAPSMHMHISWTEMKNGNSYWRVMADLNPGIVYEEDRAVFERALQEAAPDHYVEGVEQGEKYFYIPALEKHRGVVHFYLEGYDSGDFHQDECLARSVGDGVIRAYLLVLTNALSQRAEVTDSHRQKQLAYHTLYFFQVLTLDRGTTSGLLVHDQNDLGIMGSLPARVDRELLASWDEKMHSSQNELLRKLLDSVPRSGMITDVVRLQLAAVVREHYRKHPQTLEMQASGKVIPPTVENHR